MGEQKNIDRLFREKFKDFDESPDNLIWSKIEASLDKTEENKRRIIPFWWRLGGIAAALALLFSLGYYFLNSDVETEHIPVTETQQEDVLPENPETETKKELIKSDKNASDAMVTTGNDSIKNEKRSIEENLNKTIKEKEHSKNPFPSRSDTKEAVVQEENKNAVEQTDKYKDVTRFQETVSKNAVSSQNETFEKRTNASDSKSNDKKYELINNPSQKDKAIVKNTVETAVAENRMKENNVKKDTAISEKQVDEITKKQEEVVVAKNDKEDTKTSIFDAIAEKEALESEKEDKEGVDARWSINPAVAPVYYNTIGEGSPIHSQFADNSKSGNINMSYGINVAYEINDRLSIRSGINRVNFGYDTDDIAITSQALQAAPIATISYANTTANLRISDRSRGNLSPDVSREVNAEIPGVNGVLTQELGYLEVPLELKYRIVDKKLGVHVIGGFSSLFLTDNSISVASDDLVTNVGEANNINSTSFSTNIGFGVDYKLSDKILLNLEPIFKYQLNTFSSEDGGFRPYTIGVYTGLSFRF
ncbi:outer membrane beta-barrel protein [Flavobacteriaceae bacterium M23B6Z8]